MNSVETAIMVFIKGRLEAGSLSATEAEIMAAIIPADQPKLRYKPSYKYALGRLHVRHEINSVDAVDGTTHYFIGNFPSRELCKSLGLPSSGDPPFYR